MRSRNRDQGERIVDRGGLADRQITPSDLERPEADVEIERPELDSDLAKRIERARELKPIGRHFRPSWRKGLEAVLGFVEAGFEVADLRKLEAPPGDGCRACWVDGRNAAIKALEVRKA